jgi:hypothetical protein
MYKERNVKQLFYYNILYNMNTESDGDILNAWKSVKRLAWYCCYLISSWWKNDNDQFL